MKKIINSNPKRHGFRIALSCLLALCLLAAATALFDTGVAAAESSPLPSLKGVKAPYVDGNIIKNGDGSRLIIKGVNLECGRHDSQIYHDWWSFEHGNREKIAEVISANGLNAVRLNAGAKAYTAQPSHYEKLQDLIELYASKGIYSMITTHDFTSQTPDVNTLKDFFKKVITNARDAGYENSIIINPWNEGGQYPWDTWVNNCKAMLDYLRTTCGFQGIVVFDTPAFSAIFDPASADQVIAYDDALRGENPANVVISNHWYPYHGKNSRNISANCKDYPMITGELGRYVSGEPDADYAISLTSYLYATEVPNGHNGVFLWIWRWCDAGAMTDEGDGDGTVLNSEWGAPAIEAMSGNYKPQSEPDATPAPVKTDVIDNFESYNGSVENLNKAYERNTSGNSVTLTLDTSNQKEGSFGLKYDYSISDSSNFCGVKGNFKQKVTLEGYDGIQFWLKPDNSGNRLTIQMKADEVPWEGYVTLKGTDWQLVRIPFDTMKVAPWYGGIHTFNASIVEAFNIYINQDGGYNGSSTIYFDDIKPMMKSTSDTGPAPDTNPIQDASAASNPKTGDGAPIAAAPAVLAITALWILLVSKKRGSAVR